MISDIRKILGEGSPLIVYRWMPDQFLAALLLSEYLGEEVQAGYYAFTEYGATMDLISRIAIESRKYDSVVLLGPRWKGPEIDLLASNILAPLIVVDNSYNRVMPKRPNTIYFNPSPRGDPRGTWPSITFALGTIIGNARHLLVAASIVSLLSRNSIAVRAYQNSMVSNGLSHIDDYDIPELCAQRAIGLTGAGDPSAMASVPRSILEASPGDVCRGLLDDALLASLAGIVEVELESVDAGVYHVVDRVSDTIMMILSRMAAFSNNALAVTVSGDRACIWDARRNSIIKVYRSGVSIGLRGFAVHQGMINYACLEGRQVKEWTYSLLNPK